MPIDECLKKHSHRQYQAWLAWLSIEEKRATKTELYIAQNTMEIRRLYNFHAKKLETVTLEEFILKERKPSITLTLRQKLDAVSKAALARWSSLTGRKSK